MLFHPTHLPTHILIRPLSKESKRRLQTLQFDELPSCVFLVPTLSAEVSVPFSSGRGRASATIDQFPLICADALTVHKLQGQTCEFPIYIPSWYRMSLQQAYVALTQTRSIGNLYFGHEIPESLQLNWRLPRELEGEMRRLQQLSDSMISIFDQIENERRATSSSSSSSSSSTSLDNIS